MNFVELCESRRLLSAVLKSGVVTFTGTAVNDAMNVFISSKNPSRLIVSNFLDEASFAIKQVHLIRINAGRGDDTIISHDTNGIVRIPMSINAGAGNDEIIAGEGNDTIIGETGYDTINGAGGDDFVDYRYVDAPALFDGHAHEFGVIATIGTGATEPGGFEDVLGPDIEGIIGTSFRDVLTGNDVANTLIGGSGPDQLFGAGGNDSLEGGNGADYIEGGFGNDAINGGNGDDILHGNIGNDRIDGNAGNDSIFGDDGNDALKGGGDTDSITGGEGLDTFLKTENDLGFVKDFQHGFDVLS
jgi:Ca2+-binding RTX toxin-like protein